MPPSWEDIRAEFDLASEYIHLGAAQFLTSHTRVVRAAIDRYGRSIDAHPVLYVEQNEHALMQRVRDAAARTMGVTDSNEIALTDSTTMSLALLYAGLPLVEGDAVVTTDHEHYSHLESLRGLEQRRGIRICRVVLYDGRAATVQPDALVQRLVEAVTPATRAIGVTWVHSDTGLRFPVRQLADALKPINQRRASNRQVILCVDGVHGFGIETDSMAELGCDFFASGTHKWIHGPRGTGLLWGRMSAWRDIHRVVPSFTETMDAYAENDPLPEMNGTQFTPGGFHSLEYRWAAADAFEFRQQIGEQRIRARIHELSARCREGLSKMAHVTLHTPMSADLSSGIVAFEIDGLDSKTARRRLLDQRVITTVAPYPSSLLRLTPGMFNTTDEVEAGLEAIRRLR
jgi:selenocysteine lyase/cysteine desulfurase